MSNKANISVVPPAAEPMAAQEKAYTWKSRKPASFSADKTFYCVVNRTGGQGKTLVAQALASILLSSKDTIKILSADSTSAADSKGSKLARFITQTKELGTAPTADELRKDPALARSYWDRLGKIFAEPSGVPILLDVGANVIDSILAWARESRAFSALKAREEKGVEVKPAKVGGVFIIPFVSSPQAIADALSIGRALLQENLLPIKHIYFVANEWQGSFASMARDESYMELVSMANMFGGLIKIPACHAGLLRTMELHHEPILSILTPGGRFYDFDDMVVNFELDVFSAARDYDDVKEWAEIVRNSLCEIDGIEWHDAHTAMRSSGGPV